MPRILTVDDSRAIRQIVAKELEGIGFEVEEAEDGERGLAKLAETLVDLVILDVTMPVMDGPEMLKRLREGGDRTPVIMLTSESKRSVVAAAMKMGIEDYILKPFKPEELRAKVLKVIKPPQLERAEGEGGDGNVASEASSDKKQAVDVLVIDDMENVQKKLRGVLPSTITLNGAVSAQSAFTQCREKSYRVILIDTVIPDVDSVALMSQLRALQSQATFLALYLRTLSDPEKEARELGYDGFLFKPFDPASIEDFLIRYFDNQELLTAEENLLRPASFNGREDRVDKYFSRLTDLFRTYLEKVAAACFDDVVVDLSQAPLRPDKMPRLIMDLDKQTKKMGLELRLVGTPEVAKLLKNFTETATIPYYNSVQEARGG